MYNNNAPYGCPQYGTHYGQRETPQIPKANRLVYVKKEPQVPSQHQLPSQKILFNPKFMTNKVFVNPNFNQPKLAATIHINPSEKFHSKLHQMPFINQPKLNVHINPKNVPNSILKTPNVPVRISENSKNTPFVLTKTKLIRAPPNSDKKQRRNSVNSKYKIVKSGTAKLTPKNKFKIDKRKPLVPKNNLLNLSALVKSSIIKKNASSVVNINGMIYKKTKNSLRRASVGSIKEHPKKISSLKSHYKIRNNVGEAKRKSVESRYKLINKSMSLLTKNKNLVGEKRKVLRSHYKLVNKSISPSRKNIGEVQNKRKILQSQYKFINKSICLLTKNKNLVEEKRKILKSHYKLVNKSVSPFKKNRKVIGEVRKYKIVRKQSFKKRKFRKCNIPCITFRKYGLCKSKDKGKCPLKHDPDQIALCTRFLQGACLKENCRLSHNVLPEKIATCKYYLEGACLKEKCPYLHVKISPKAEVCNNFLEGFCEKAAQCEKRHQYLCPDYEKYGKCMKPRCQYPHGKMVRTYLIDKNHFAKKCSTSTDLKSKNITDLPSKSDDEEKPRYYAEDDSDSDEVIAEKKSSNLEAVEERNSDLINLVGSETRPKLGKLSAFIGFSEL